MMNRELHTQQHHAANTTSATTDPSSQVGMWWGKGARECSLSMCAPVRITQAGKVFICSCLKSESKRNFLMIFLKLHKMHFIEY